MANDKNTSGPEPRFSRIGDGCALLDFGNIIDEQLNCRVIALAGKVSASGFPGFVECTPAYSSLAIYYDPLRVIEAEGADEDPFEKVCDMLRDAASEKEPDAEETGDSVIIRAKFGGQEGPDLDEVSERSGLGSEEVLRRFLSRDYRVYMLGFLPGFAYMGTVDPSIAAPRKETPRTKVPAGSIGIAGDQTGIYPFDSPGGWQLIGRTAMTMFDPDREQPALLKPGDRVKFVADG